MTRLMMIAGPNGAGKTTTANAFLSQQKNLYDEFLNADHIEDREIWEKIQGLPSPTTR